MAERNRSERKMKYAKSVIVSLLIFFPVFFSSGQDTGRQISFNQGDLILVPEGEFLMGSPESELWRETDEVLHRVRLDSFYLSPYEVTQEEYERILGENPSHFRGANLPVENVSWYDAVEFCNALSRKFHLQPAYRIQGKEVFWDRDADGYRLPTEAEWEYACRAGTDTPFYQGDAVAAEDVNYFGYYPYTVEDHYFSRYQMETPPGVYRETTVPVDSFEPNAWGFYNMHGNVSEWCFDLYGEYETGNVQNPSGSSKGVLRVTRGGGWNDFAKHLRSAYRSATPPGDRFYSRGFRLARKAE